MINMFEVNETNNMITQEKLDVRTITMGISLLDCIDSSVEKVCENVYNKITTLAKNLVSTGKDIEKEYGIPIVNKRISVTPIALVGSAACKTRQSSKRGWCKLPWRLFCTCKQGYDKGRGAVNSFNPEGTCCDRACVQLS